MTMNSLMGCLSSFTFAFVSPIIRLGRSQGYLHLTDIPPLTHNDATAGIAARFAHSWRQQIVSRKQPSLVAAFYHLLGGSYIALGVLKFVSDLTVFIGPILLNDLVSFLTSQAHDATPEPAWHGVLYATLLVLGVVLSSILGTQYTWRSRRLAMRVRTAIVSVVYSKSCSVSGLAKRAFGSGRVTNVMSVDTERIMDIFTSFHDFWSLPVQIAVALYLLHAQVGLALLAGLGVVVLLIPINALLTNRIAKVSRRMMKCKDRRVQLTNEMLHHIRAIKQMALEQRFLSRLRAIRRQEMKALTTRKYLDAFCVYFWATTPIIVSVATFAMYALLGNQLTAARVFTSLALFATLIRPLNSFPWVINGPSTTLLSTAILLLSRSTVLLSHSLSPSRSLVMSVVVVRFGGGQSECVEGVRVSVCGRQGGCTVAACCGCDRGRVGDGGCDGQLLFSEGRAEQHRKARRAAQRSEGSTASC